MTYQHSAILYAYIYQWNEDITQYNVTTWSKGWVTWYVIAPQHKPPLFSGLMVKGLAETWKRKVFILSKDITWPYDQCDIWLGKFNSFNIGHHAVSFGIYSCSISEDITFLLCHMAKFDAYRSCGSRYLAFIIKLVISRDSMTKG